MRFEKAARLLGLAQRLAGTAEGMTLDEMAQELAVNRRTAERMRDALRDLFPGLEEIADGRTKRYRISGGIGGFYTAPTTDELAELDLAVRTHAARGAGARETLLASLARKVRAAMRDADRRRTEPDLAALALAEGLVMQAGPRPLADPETLATVREGLKAMRLCVFDYAAATGFAYRREVAPWGLLFGHAWYLVGPEGDKPEPMLWRFDRIHGLRLGAAFAGAPAAFSLAAFAARSFGAFQEAPETVELRFHPSAAEDVRRFSFHPTQLFEPQADGSVLVRFEAGGMSELVHHLFSWGDTVEIVAPPRLKAAMGEALQAALAAHAPS